MRKISVQSSNALEQFDTALEPVLKAKRVVVLLDYDGTLTPIVNDPAKAHLPSRTRDILVELAERCVVGIVSGCVAYAHAWTRACAVVDKCRRPIFLTHPSIYQTGGLSPRCKGSCRCPPSSMRVPTASTSGAPRWRTRCATR